MSTGTERQIFEHAIGYIFEDQTLLVEALSHASVRESVREARENSRLAFLGDALLDFFIAEELFEDARSLPKGDLTMERAKLVANAKLARTPIPLPITLGGSIKSDDVPDSVRATTTEAVIGATYRDGGLAAARRVARRLVPREG